jgi:hypothetical protein
VIIAPPVLGRIAAGDIDLQFRRWRRPTVRAGGTLRTAIGVLHIGAVDIVQPADVTASEAHRAGYQSRDALLADVDYRDDALYRIRLHLAGEDPRIALRETQPTASERSAILQRLERLDRASKHGPWTASTLRLIAERPGVRAADLAASVGRETLPFKADVRRLKELGLTESLEVGYRLAPRGRAVLDSLGDHSIFM